MGRFSVYFRSFTEIYPGNIIKKFIQKCYCEDKSRHYYCNKLNAYASNV